MDEAGQNTDFAAHYKEGGIVGRIAIVRRERREVSDKEGRRDAKLAETESSGSESEMAFPRAYAHSAVRPDTRQRVSKSKALV